MISAVCQEPLNTQLFWELRQRFSQGHFTGNTEAVKENAVLELYQLTNPRTLIAQYHSDIISSTESLILPVTLGTYMASQNIIPDHLICQTATSIVFETSDTTELYFIADRESMRQTLGILDFQGTEQVLIDTTLWLHHSVITHR